MTPTPIDILAQQVSANLHLPQTLFRAQIQIESSDDPWAFRYEHNFFKQFVESNPNAKGFSYGPLAACSFGLLQVLLETALELGFDGPPQDLFVPRVGLTWGAKYLSACWNASGGTEDRYPWALCRFNAGLNAHPPFSNIAYAQKIYAQAGVVMPIPIVQES